jgi:hypothetical protein
LDFGKILDPYTAYQELSMYLGAKARPEMNHPNVPDEFLLQQKGFDCHSFRKEPTKRKRKDCSLKS